MNLMHVDFVTKKIGFFLGFILQILFNLWIIWTTIFVFTVKHRYQIKRWVFGHFCAYFLRLPIKINQTLIFPDKTTESSSTITPLGMESAMSTTTISPHTAKENDWMDIPFTILKASLMISIIVAAVFGNLLVIISVMRNRKLRWVCQGRRPLPLFCHLHLHSNVSKVFLMFSTYPDWWSLFIVHRSSFIVHCLHSINESSLWWCFYVSIPIFSHSSKWILIISAPHICFYSQNSFLSESCNDSIITFTFPNWFYSQQNVGHCWHKWNYLKRSSEKNKWNEKNEKNKETTHGHNCSLLSPQIMIISYIYRLQK